MPRSRQARSRRPAAPARSHARCGPPAACSSGRAAPGSPCRGRLAHRDVRVGEVRRRRDAVGPLTELVERVDRALQRPPALRAAAGNSGGSRACRPRRRTAPASSPRGARPSPARRRRRPRPVAARACRGQRHDVGDRLLPAVGDADLGHVRVVRDPHLAKRVPHRSYRTPPRWPRLVGGDRRRPRRPLSPPTSTALPSLQPQ